jgi:flagellar hook assembly protein FlgD
VVLDRPGRCGRPLHAGPLAAGSHLFTWDGRDAAGNAEPAGIYWLRLESRGEQTARRVVRLR